MLTRRTFLRTLAAGAATLVPLGGGRFLRRLPLGRRSPVPALVAAPTVDRTLVELNGLTGGAGAAAVAYAASPPQPTGPGIPGRRWVMVIDLARCDGCRECTRACQGMHFTPAGQEWIRVYELRDNEVAAPYWFPRPCMQCDNAPCVKVCPVSAAWKREDGIVMQDTSRCIGCRFCIAACPYGARSFNWVQPPETEAQQSLPYSDEWNQRHRKGTTEKCIFCPGLVKEGRLPACVAACPMGAIYFGDQEEDAVTNSQGETVRFSELIRQNAGYRFLEELGTEPRVYYLPPRKRVYPAPPDEPQPATRGVHP
ncbi:MAG: 4Fe-4S dicluster domain-containing protein [Armatimonadota bacterium]|nr:4Fe-4S dicluster domain-containing protein [Armatimonadota bacterium]MDR7450570.1 4Fe-4S dicluster domain-containing protein [Armatimonadota bacterium]MDR7466297.1 4Fe-4S dicluster domain-containing protein [Armatimonadota bacterium]MDR7493018.1 4Fe-4S dicluster domain-containing protein [Armatimonadota bacterium]MDR7498225.1 4Fe-4S dicluster domain-containing protein [Armatimonadota bacterium]